MANWRDIQIRAEEFALKYADAKDEDRDSKPFWKELLEIYGVDPRQIGAFEERVRIHGRPGVGKIDYFAPSKFIIEHKSRGRNLDAAYKQALDYFDALPEATKPRYIIVSDFENIRIYDLLAPDEKRLTQFLLKDLSRRVESLAFFDDQEVQEYRPEEAIDVKAVRTIGKLHDALELANYTPEHIAPFLTRVVFCCFADDTGIFVRESLLRYLEQNTKADGSDIGSHLNSIFEILNTPDSERQTNMHSTLENLPYVNGGLFAERLNVVFASREIRETLIACMAFDWSQISPAIFGSMFQSVMDETERHDLGAHYTSEINILKVISSLFLDELNVELEAAKSHREKLLALQDKIASITLLDPACGCGNFLVVSYRELRRIENEIIARLHKKAGTDRVDAGHMVLPLEVDIKKLSKMSVERMYGIEIDAFAVEVAKLSLWLMDHKMNAELGQYFGTPFVKLPLKEQPHIVKSNALRVRWDSLVPRNEITHVLGNPPFNGAANKTADQIDDMKLVFSGEGGKLDYVAAWYKRAIEFMGDLPITAAFVSTNSITQGEQVALLWPILWRNDFAITFAHQTFKWSNEAPGKAAVYCVIVGFARHNDMDRSLFVYDDVTGTPVVNKIKNINGYLIDGPNIVIDKRRAPISPVPAMVRGSIPYDNGLLLMSEDEKDRYINSDPEISKWIRRYGGSNELLNNQWRYCFWLINATPNDMRAFPEIMRRVEAVRLFRESSETESVLRAADTPYLFGDLRQPSTSYLMFPRVSSEKRVYLPIAYVDSDTILADSAYGVPDASLYMYGILQSLMHMTWMRAVCGRLESRYRYSNNIVYNNFPWPDEPSAIVKKSVELAAEQVLRVRDQFANNTLSDLYDPLTMPLALIDAHKLLNRAVDNCYGVKGFAAESDRLEFLFKRYEKLANRDVSSSSPRKRAKKVKK